MELKELKMNCKGSYLKLGQSDLINQPLATEMPMND